MKNQEKINNLRAKLRFQKHKREDLLISKFITGITDKKLRNKVSIPQKNRKLKTTVEHITQNSYDRRQTQSTIPPALAKDKEIKQKPIQKIQGRQYREQRKIPRRNDCGFCGQAKWTPRPQPSGKNSKMQQLVENRTYCTGMPWKTKQHEKKTNYLEVMTSEEDEEESDPNEIYRITQINKK